MRDCIYTTKAFTLLTLCLVIAYSMTYSSGLAIIIPDKTTILKTRIDEVTKRFVPLTPRFQSNKWKRPLKEDIRDQIRFKKNLISGGHTFETEIIQVG